MALYPRLRYKDRISLYLSPTQLTARNALYKKITKQYTYEKIVCPICNSTQNTMLAERDCYGFPVTVVVCVSCGLIYNSPRLDEKSLQDMYTHEYRALDSRDATAIGDFFKLEVQKGEHAIQRIKKDSGSALEVGCGAGGFLKPFQEQGFSVTGCDFNEDYLAYGRGQGLNLIRGSIDDVTNIFDVIIYEQTLEHISNLKNELAKVRTKLKDDGILYIGVPSIRHIPEQYHSDFLRFLQIPHLTHFELATLTNLMQKNGFALIEGNEMLSATFKKGPYVKDFTPVNPIPFLLKMERERKLRRILSFPRHFAHRVVGYIQKRLTL